MEAPSDPTVAEALSAQQFLKHLADSGLMTADEIQASVAQVPAAQRADARQLAQELVRLDKLTRYQAAALLQGKPKGLLLGNYVILDKLGQGGMGMVLKARHRRMERVVALKVLSPAVVKNSTAVQRFQREIKAAAKLSHPNIVAAHDADEAKGVHFLVMEYVPGRDLSALVKQRGPLPVDLAVQCIIQVAQGLRHAHEAGIVHRDIKPANLLLDNQGVVKILDMGLARIEGPGNQAGAAPEELTQSGSIMGTCDYMAPEQALNTKRADARADVYSLGCTLYYLLTGKAMYGGETLMEKMMAHQTEAIPSLTNVPKKLQAAYSRMVAKKPEERLQTMVEVVTELEASLPRPGTPAALSAWQKSLGGPRGSDEATIGDAENSRTPTRSVSEGRGKSLTLRVGAGVVALLLVALGVWLWPKSDTGKIADNAPTPPTRDAIDGAEKLFTNSLGMKMVLIPKGKFLMGGGGGKAGNQEVEIKHDFYLGQYEVTQWEWREVMGDNPSTFKEPPLSKEELAKLGVEELRKHWKTMPVESVLWEDCQEFIKRLNQKEKTAGWIYRLPTEAEWEYSCRGGGGRPAEEYAFDFYFEQPTNTLQPDMANVLESAKKRTCPVGTYKPNRLGLYDLHGNVREWCQDEIPGDPKDPKAASRRVLRGGDWSNESGFCRATSRYPVGNSRAPSDRRGYVGLRLARVPDDSGNK